MTYMSADGVRVPPGAKHVMLSSIVQGGLAGGPDGAAVIFGMLRVRASVGGSWQIVDSGYQLETYGSNYVQNAGLYGKGTLEALVDLSALTLGGEVPDEIDIRVQMAEVTVGNFNFEVNEVCNGKLYATF